jgi:hypothetical protein
MRLSCKKYMNELNSFQRKNVTQTDCNLAGFKFFLVSAVSAVRIGRQSRCWQERCQLVSYTINLGVLFQYHDVGTSKLGSCTLIS